MANTQLSDATHILVYIAMHQADLLKSELIAESLQTDATMVRHIMSRLKKAALLQSVRGVARPTLTRPADQISLRDIYLAVSDKHRLLNVDNDTSRSCPIGSVIPQVMHHYYHEIQSSAEERMARISLQDIINDVKMSQREKVAN